MKMIDRCSKCNRRVEEQVQTKPTQSHAGLSVINGKTIMPKPDSHVVVAVRGNNSESFELLTEKWILFR